MRCEFPDAADEDGEADHGRAELLGCHYFVTKQRRSQRRFLMVVFSDEEARLDRQSVSTGHSTFYRRINAKGDVKD